MPVYEGKSAGKSRTPLPAPVQGGAFVKFHASVTSPSADGTLKRTLCLCFSWHFDVAAMQSYIAGIAEEEGPTVNRVVIWAPRLSTAQRLPPASHVK